MTLQIFNAQTKHLYAVKNHLELLSYICGGLFIPLKLNVVSVLNRNNTTQKILFSFLFCFSFLFIFIVVLNKIIKAVKTLVFTIDTRWLQVHLRPRFYMSRRCSGGMVFLALRYTLSMMSRLFLIWHFDSQTTYLYVNLLIVRDLSTVMRWLMMLRLCDEFKFVFLQMRCLDETIYLMFMVNTLLCEGFFDFWHHFWENLLSGFTFQK